MPSFPDFPGPAGGPDFLRAAASWSERTFCTGEFAARLSVFLIATGIVCAWLRMRTPSVKFELQSHQYLNDATNATLSPALNEVVIVSSESATSNTGLSTSTLASQIPHRPSDSLDVDRNFPHTFAEEELELPMSMILCKEGPNTFTGIGAQFDVINSGQTDTNIPRVEDEYEEIDLEMFAPLSEDRLSSLMIKHEENVWEFIRG